MATGILSVVALHEGQHILSLVFLWVALVVFTILAALSVARGALASRAVLRDLGDPSRSFGFFTVVAASGILGARLVLLGRGGAALALLVAASAAWAAISCAVASLLAARGVPDHGSGPNGEWLLAVVGTQSVAMLLTVAPGSTPGPATFFGALSLWLLGLGVYVVLIVLLVGRVLLRGLRPADLTPDYWITMGALAISTLVAARLHAVAAQDEALHSLAPAIAVLGAATWAAGSAWIPLLVIGEVWRARAGLGAWRYDSRRWSMVFPLGMYSAATHDLSAAIAPPGLATLAHAFFWIAVAAWIAALAASLRALADAKLRVVHDRLRPLL